MNFRVAMKRADVSYRFLTIRYLSALGLVATLSVSAFVLLSFALRQQATSAAVINVAGRQLMLSQSIALDISKMRLAKGQTEFAKLRDSAKFHIMFMRDSHKGLIEGDEQAGLPDTIPDKAMELYFGEKYQFSKVIEDFLISAETLTQVDLQDFIKNHQQVDAFLHKAEGEIMQKLTLISTVYKRDSEAKSEQIQKMELGVFSMTLCILILEALFIFHPMVKRISYYVDQLNESNEALQKVTNARQQFLNNVAHIIRTPLNHICGFSSRLLKRDTDTLSERQLTALQTISKSSKKLSEQVSDILKITEMGKTQDEIELVSIDETFKQFAAIDIQLINETDWEANKTIALEKQHLELLLSTLLRLLNDAQIENVSITSKFFTQSNDNILEVKMDSQTPIGYGDGENIDSRQILLSSLAEFYNGENLTDHENGSYTFICRLVC